MFCTPGKKKACAKAYVFHPCFDRSRFNLRFYIFIYRCGVNCQGRKKTERGLLDCSALKISPGVLTPKVTPLVTPLFAADWQ